MQFDGYMLMQANSGQSVKENNEILAKLQDCRDAK